ncbi:LysE/ArgO family amino acid transporter [Paenibacillus sp. XY044]|uniref:LysE/ArgO family amino acid transporter n=1 Tax=Paenibacillus sp. XY044 TaxID=2026089 RepID=UPI000B991A9E|nr:LysE/ArgO family amino acid transporter [Paenibacillus sp. XY044]OZB96574.1 lysine transporter LysE [Paenibacillus sp. XY044]
MIHAILHGFILALGLILPLGVQNLFVFSQGAAHTRLTRALPAVAAASLCDTLLISLAIMGVSVVVLEYAWIKTVLFSLGIPFLLYMGYITLTSKPAVQNGEASRSFSTRKQIAFAVSVSLLNPHAILDTVGVVGTSSLNYAGGERLAFGAACITVSWVWFAGLASAGRAARRLDSTGKLRSWLNILSAIIMWGTAAYLAYSLFMG